MGVEETALPVDEPASGLGLDGTEALSAQQNSTSYQPSALPRKGKIGVVWAAGHKPDADACTRSEQRSLPPDVLVSVLNQQLGSLWKGGPIQLINMQHDREVPKNDLLRKYIQEVELTNSWLETRQKLESLQGLICVDTAIAHLAGQTSVPTIVVLNTPCDWRWGDNGNRTLGTRTLF